MSLTIKICSENLKLRIPELHAEFPRILFENPPAVNILIDRRNANVYSYQQWVLKK